MERQHAQRQGARGDGLMRAWLLIGQEEPGARLYRKAGADAAGRACGRPARRAAGWKDARRRPRSAFDTTGVSP